MFTSVCALSRVGVGVGETQIGGLPLTKGRRRSRRPRHPVLRVCTNLAFRFRIFIRRSSVPHHGTKRQPALVSLTLGASRDAANARKLAPFYGCLLVPTHHLFFLFVHFSRERETDVTGTKKHSERQQQTGGEKKNRIKIDGKKRGRLFLLWARWWRGALFPNSVDAISERGFASS